MECEKPSEVAATLANNNREVYTVEKRDSSSKISHRHRGLLAMMLCTARARVEDVRGRPKTER